MKNILLFWIIFFLQFLLCHNEMEAISPSSNQTDSMHSQGSRQLSPDLGANLQSLIKIQRALACPNYVNRSHTMCKNSLLIVNGV